MVKNLSDNGCITLLSSSSMKQYIEPQTVETRLESDFVMQSLYGVSTNVGFTLGGRGDYIPR